MSDWLEEAAVRDRLGLPPGGQRRFTAIATDTRALPAGALFVALAGERFDGHAFLAAARDAGAAAAVVRHGTAPVEGLPLLEVDDPLRAYGTLALARRRAVPGPVVAITGTNGKTSTKELVAAVLRTRFRTHATRANLNNLVGVPLTILEAPADTEALVVEAGASLPGEIARARAIIEPDIAIVTNVAAGHVEGFGSLAAIRAEKLALTDGVPLVLVGTQPPGLADGARARGAGTVRSVGLAGADVVPERVTLRADGRPELRVNGRTVTLPLLGEHQAANALFAWAVARELGLDLDAAAGALAGVSLPGGRGQWLDLGGVTVLHDAYNANPASFRAAIALARRLREGRRLVFVAGTMRELGELEAEAHREVAEALVALEPDVLAAVGAFVPALARWSGRLGERLITAPDADALAAPLAARLRAGDLVVLKASRGVALEHILPAIASRFA